MNTPLNINNWSFNVYDDLETVIEENEAYSNGTLDNFAGLPSEVYLIRNWWDMLLDKVVIGENATCRDVIKKVLEFYKGRAIDIGTHQYFEGFNAVKKENGKIEIVGCLGS